uniref:Transposase n=1 Tax=Ignisphaera aggregans TaxID=334771 RepID=A0A7C4BAZ3_9CREN
MECTACGFTGDRDVVAVANLYRKYSSNPRCGEHGVSPNAGEAPSGMRGNKVRR